VVVVGLRRKNAAASGGKQRQDFGVLEEFLENFLAREIANRKSNIRMAKVHSSSLAKQIAELEEKAPKGIQCIFISINWLQTNAT